MGVYLVLDTGGDDRKGVSYMENRYEWHGSPPDSMDISGAPPKGEQAKEALKQLEELEKKINAND